MSPTRGPSGTRRLAGHGAAPRRGPLAWAQTEIWDVIERLATGSASLNLCAVRPVAGHDPQQVQAALSALISRHEILRTLFTADDGVPVQHVQARAELDMPVYALADDEVEEGAQQISRQLRGLPFDAARELPLRAAMVLGHTVPPRVVLVLNHLAVDGGSLALLVRELDLLLADPGALGKPAYQPLDRAAWEQSADGRRHAARSLAHWERAVRATPRTWFENRHRAGRPEGRWARIDSPALALAVRVLAHRSGMTPGMVGQAGVAALLGLTRGEHTVGLRLIVSPRFQPETRSLVAAFNQNALLRTELAEESFTAYLRRSGAATLDAYTACEYEPRALGEMTSRIGAELGFGTDGFCFYNDVRYGGEDPAWRDPLPPDWAANLTALGSSTQTQQLPTLGTLSDPFFLYVDSLTDRAQLTLCVDRRLLPDPAGFLADLAWLLEQAALTDAAPPALAAGLAQRVSARPQD